MSEPSVYVVSGELPGADFEYSSASVEGEADIYYKTRAGKVSDRDPPLASGVGFFSESCQDTIKDDGKR